MRKREVAPNWREYRLTDEKRRELWEEIIKTAKEVIELNKGHDIEFVLERGRR